MKRRLDLSRTDTERLINEWILNARDRDILRRRLIDGVPFEELAEEFNLSTQRVKAIVYQSHRTLSLHM